MHRVYLLYRQAAFLFMFFFGRVCFIDSIGNFVYAIRFDARKGCIAYCDPDTINYIQKQNTRVDFRTVLKCKCNSFLVK